jgi:hypothetical protein
MSSKFVSFRCPFCGHTWRKDRAALEKKNQVIVKGSDIKTYRDQCDKCDTFAVTDVKE